MGKGKEGDSKRGGRGGEEGEGRKGKGGPPVPDCESAKVATLKCGGLSTMPEENRGPWSKKFENRWTKHLPSVIRVCPMLNYQLLPML